MVFGQTIVAAAAFLLAASVLAVVSTPALAPPGSSPVRNTQVIAPPARCAGEDITSTKQRARAIRAMVCLNNFARRQGGLAVYRAHPKLGRSASQKAADILRCDAFSHTACGRPFTWWIEKGYARRKCWTAAENIAWGDEALGSPREIFEAWMNSPRHRSAILSRRYRDVSIGFRAGGLGGRSSARVWVQHFGKIC